MLNIDRSVLAARATAAENKHEIGEIINDQRMVDESRLDKNFVALMTRVVNEQSNINGSAS
jgi:hypothetical protein